MVGRRDHRPRYASPSRPQQVGYWLLKSENAHGDPPQCSTTADGPVVRLGGGGDRRKQSEFETEIEALRDLLVAGMEPPPGMRTTTRRPSASQPQFSAASTRLRLLAFDVGLLDRRSAAAL